MFCDRCGTALQQFQRFCPSWGEGVSAVPPIPAESRIAGHLRLLGILRLAISAFRLLPGLFLVSIFHSGFPHVAVAVEIEVRSVLPGNPLLGQGGVPSHRPQSRRGCFRLGTTPPAA